MWGVTEDALPSVSPFWLSVAHATSQEQFDSLAEMEEGATELRMRVTCIDLTLKSQYQKTMRQDSALRA